MRVQFPPAPPVKKRKNKGNNMITLVIGAVVGFVAGVLVGRRNSQKVETTVAEVKTVVDKTGVKL